ncbi:MAG: hypothetical protein WBA87_15660 [Microbacterium sp.]
MRDWFDWLSLVAIPGLAGIGTVAVSIAALVSSSRAQALSRGLEAQREADEKQRDRDARLERLRGMAIVEARAVHRLVTESIRPRMVRSTELSRRLPLAGSAPDRDQARVDADVMLRQSIVPGSEELLEITLFDLANRWSKLPENVDGWSSFRKAMVAERHERMISRIREWALNPEVESKRIAAEWALAQSDPLTYLLMGHELAWEIEDNSGPSNALHFG